MEIRKNHEKIKFPESVQGHPRVSPGCQGGFKTPQRSILRCPGTSENDKILEKLKISIQIEGLGMLFSPKQLDSSCFCASFGASFIKIRWMDVENEPLQNLSFFNPIPAARSSPLSPLPPLRPTPTPVGACTQDLVIKNRPEDIDQARYCASPRPRPPPLPPCAHYDTYI